MTFVNAAIHNSEKEMNIYKVDPKKSQRLKHWTKGIASFNENHHKLTNTPSEVIVTERVPCITLNELLQNHDIKTADLLQIDTEGYDAEIILNMDLNIIRPKIINFEHGLSAGTMNKETFSKVCDFLRNHGYNLSLNRQDLTAYLLEDLI